MAVAAALRAGLLLAFAAPALGSAGGGDAAACAPPGADEQQAVSLLQTGSRAAARKQQPADAEHPFAPVEPADGGHADLQALLAGAPGGVQRMVDSNKVTGVTFLPDINGKPCWECPIDIETSVVPRDFWAPDYTYVNRTDCGNRSIAEHPELASVPVASFSAPARPGHNATNGYCELNFLIMCETARWNRDFLYYAKNFYIPDWYRKDSLKNRMWCKHNGMFDPEIVALQHDFDGMQAKADELCETKYAKMFNLSSLTADMFSTVKMSNINRGYPTPAEAAFEAAFMCAMGTLGCDMAACVYDFCDLGNGEIGIYDDCEGWTKLGGMPVRAK